MGTALEAVAQVCVKDSALEIKANDNDARTLLYRMAQNWVIGHRESECAALLFPVTLTSTAPISELFYLQTRQ